MAAALLLVFLCVAPFFSPPLRGQHAGSRFAGKGSEQESRTVVPGGENVKARAECQEPEYFGLCDPYVPGILISGKDYQPVKVRDTWPYGPAEKAGICTGDKVMGVNGIVCSKETFERVLRAIVQASPVPLLLKIQRGGSEFEVAVVPVRESELVSYTGRKYLRKAAVPSSQQPEGLSRVDDFLQRVGKSFELKSVEGPELWMPADLPAEDIERIVSAGRSWKRERRIGAVIPAFRSAEDWSTGCSFALLKQPREIIVIQTLPDSPGYKAGLRPGDQVLRVGAIDPSSDSAMERIEELLSPGRQGRRINLRIRQRSSKELEVTVEEIRASTFRGQELDPITARPTTLFSLNDDPERGAWITGLNLLFDKRRGEAIVTEVDFPSPAFDAGLLIGDQILSVDRTAVARLNEIDLEKCVQPGRDGTITFEVKRGSESLTFTLHPETRSSALSRIGRKESPQGPVPVTCCPE